MAVASASAFLSGARAILQHVGDPNGAELKQIVIDGPDPTTSKVVRWRCVDLRDEVERRFGVRVNERTIGKWLRQLRLTRLQPRPFHPKKDAAAEQAFKNGLGSAGRL